MSNCTIMRKKRVVVVVANTTVKSSYFIRDISKLIYQLYTQFILDMQNVFIDKHAAH